MKIDRKIIYSVVGLSLTGAAVLGGTYVYAADNNTQYPPLVTSIAQKFNLNPADVQNVFTQNKQNMMQKRDAEFKTKLDADVAAGKITSTQEQLIIQKRQELENGMKNNKAAMDKQRQDLEAWAKQNNIDLKYLMVKGGRVRHGMGPK